MLLTQHSLLICNCLVDQLLHGWLAELPAILESIFSGPVNITSSPIGGW